MGNVIIMAPIGARFLPCVSKLRSVSVRKLFVHVPFSRNMSQQPRIPEHLSAEKSRPFLSIF